MITRSWAPVSGNGRRARNRPTSSPPVAWDSPAVWRSSQRLRLTSSSCTRRSSSNMRRLPRLARFGHGGGPVDAFERGVPAHEAEPCQHAGGHRVEYPARSAAVEGLLDELADVPCVHTGLLRLRVHGKEATGAVPDEVDHRIRHLERASKPLRAAVNNHLEARAQSLLLPRLVEERELESTGLVGDDHLDELPALPDEPRGAAVHGALHKDLLALGQLGDAGLLGAVDVATRVVLEQIQHRVDLHLGERGGPLAADAAQPGDVDCVEVPEGEGRVAGRHRRAGRSASYSRPK